MKTIFYFFLAVLPLAGLAEGPNEAVQPVNAVIGDISYIWKYGKAPGIHTNEQLRIATHLEYVEKLLRSRDASGLPQELQESRAELLDHLHEYWNAGAFPVNYDFPGERRPCFIDKNGNICAVGYLVEQSAGRKMAEAINARYQYSYIADMNMPALLGWVENSGLTLEECAMIQPEYGHYVHHSQSFDGNDTFYTPIVVELENAPDNLWQIGSPDKFNGAYSLPNAIVTDTSNPYSSNNESVFEFTLAHEEGADRLTLQWQQTLDMDSLLDWGKVEYSIDGGLWQDAVGNAGFCMLHENDSNNMFTAPTGELAFSGTDTAWRWISLCYDMYSITIRDSITFRFTFLSDAIDNQRSGWMIDNIMATYFTSTYGVDDNLQHPFRLHPNPTTGEVKITNGPKPLMDSKIELFNIQGRLLDIYELNASARSINIGDHANGLYYLRHTANGHSSTVKVVLEK